MVRSIMPSGSHHHSNRSGTYGRARSYISSIHQGVKRAHSMYQHFRNSGVYKKRRQSVPSTVSTERSRRSSLLSNSTVSPTSNLVTSASTRAPKVVRSKKRLHLKGRKKIKVSPKLRKAIIEVSDGTHIHGYYQDNRVDLCDPALLGGQQNVERLPNRTLNFAGYLFNYDRILHAASRLWNAKASNTQPNVVDAGNFNPLDTVINVKRQWWTFRMRNNSSRTAQIRIYKCQKKNNVQNTDAQFLWSAALAQMTTTGELISTTTINTLHTSPTLANQFRVGYKVEELKITLDPGQAYEFNVQGPSMVYDGKKFYDQTTYRPVQIQDIQLLWVSNGDLIGSTTAGVANAWGYAPDSTTNVPAEERVIVESTYHCSLSMPEKVGGVSTAVASIFQNANRVKRVCIDEFGPVVFGTNDFRRDEENPQAAVV